MNYLKIFFCSLVILSASSAFAQKSNSEKILGCWTFKKMEFNNKNEQSEELNKQAQNSYVCFTSDGKFTTVQSGNNSAPIKGSFEISKDGKTITQTRELSGDGFDEDAEIKLLDDKQFILRTEFATIYFVKK